MKLANDFYNKLASDISSTYFPHVKYHRDDKQNQKATYAIELFNNGCMTYKKLVLSLSKYCKDTVENIENIVDKYVLL